MKQVEWDFHFDILFSFSITSSYSFSFLGAGFFSEAECFRSAGFGADCLLGVDGVKGFDIGVIGRICLVIGLLICGGNPREGIPPKRGDAEPGPNLPGGPIPGWG